MILKMLAKIGDPEINNKQVEEFKLVAMDKASTDKKSLIF